MSSSSAGPRTPEGAGSVAGAPNLPAGFADTFASRYVDTGEVRLHTAIGGEGPPLLLVHGWPQTWYAWRMVMPSLAADFTIVAPDQRGIGLSDKPADGYDAGTLAADLVALMDALDHPRFALYGTCSPPATASSRPARSSCAAAGSGSRRCLKKGWLFRATLSRARSTQCRSDGWTLPSCLTRPGDDWRSGR